MHKSEKTVHYRAPRKSRVREGSVMNVNLTPAIDITFNLLIFFIVATTFKAAEGVLPSEAPARQGVLEATALPVSPIKVRVRQTGEGAQDYQLKIDHLRLRPDSFVQLTGFLGELQARPGFDDGTPVIIYADDHVRWDFVVRCFNAVRRVNCEFDPAHPRARPFQDISFAVGH